jgi:hypothetical protein
MCKALALTLSALLGAACAGTASTDVEYGGSVTVTSPELVSIGEPDVFVVADADQPVFFTDSMYWLYRNDGWYRSQRYDRGWVRVDAPPVRLRHIDQPLAYVHYRARAETARNQRQAPTNYEPRERDQMRPQPQTEPTPQPQQAPLQPLTAPKPPIANPQPPPQQPPVDPDQVPQANDH